MDTNKIDCPPRPKPLIAAHVVLHGFSQIYCQRSVFTGATLLTLMYAAAPQMAFAACLALGTATLCALALRAPRTDIANGIYGYNAALSGAGLAAGFQPGLALLLWIGVAGVFCAVATRVLRQKGGLPVLTSPFIAVMLLANWLGPLAGLQMVEAGGNEGNHHTLPAFVLHAFAQASFLDSPVAGLLVLAAVTRRHRQAAVWAVAAGLSVWCASTPGTGLDAYLTGITLNCMLSAICLTENRRGLNGRIGGIAATAGIGLLCASLELRVFTLPFVAACWVVLRSTREERAFAALPEQPHAAQLR
ncbi:urea transporter [Undibacterium sp. TJN25]|uniref:urea transporter n=1 Tax=Undibacterium sp. TJN25 TaxID=3413056 RepID=UPI003BF01B29